MNEERLVSASESSASTLSPAGLRLKVAREKLREQLPMLSELF